MCSGTPGLDFHSRWRAPQPFRLTTVSASSSTITSSTGIPVVRNIEPLISRTSWPKCSTRSAPAGSPCPSHAAGVSCQNHSKRPMRSGQRLSRAIADRISRPVGMAKLFFYPAAEVDLGKNPEMIGGRDPLGAGVEDDPGG